MIAPSGIFLVVMHARDVYKVNEQRLLQLDMWLEDVDMNTVFALLYNVTFCLLCYERYSFILNMVPYHNDHMQYILFYSNHWILYHIHSITSCFHYTIYDFMTLVNWMLPLEVVFKLQFDLTMTNSLYYTYISMSNNSPTMFFAAYLPLHMPLSSPSTSILPYRSCYNVSLMRWHLYNCICLSMMASPPLLNFALAFHSIIHLQLCPLPL